MTKIGVRYTKPRKLVFEVLKHLSKPVSASEINDYLDNKIDLASVYRTLNLLVKSKIVNVILFGDGVKRYEIMENNLHHHHLICENCGSIEDIPLNEMKLLKEVKKQSNFKVIRHSLEFFGLCKNCQ